MMFQDEENKLYRAKDNYDNIIIPENIEDFIVKGMKKGKRANKRIKVTKFTSLVASFFITVFIASIAILPAFADYLSQIPGIGYFISLFSYDQGMQSALENDFIQIINESDEHEGYKLTVEGIVIDESRMVIFYNVETEVENVDIYLSEVGFTNDKGEGLRAAYGISPPQYEDLYKNYKGTIDVSFSEETEITEQINMTCKIGIAERNKDKLVITQSLDDKLSHFNREKDQTIWDRELEGLFEINLKIDKERFQNLRETYNPREEVIVRGQKFTVEKVTIHPTRIELDIAYDKNNTMNIYSFDDLRLVDKGGNEFSSISNGITASYIGENAIRLYMQSNYFKLSDELYLQGSVLKALDKARSQVIIDLENKKIVKQPDDRFELTYVNYNDSKGTIEMEIKFEHEVLKEEEINRFIGVGLSYVFIDENGNEYTGTYSGSSATGYEGKHIYKIYYEIEKDESLGKLLTFNVINYPETIEEPFEVKIK